MTRKLLLSVAAVVLSLAFVTTGARGAALPAKVPPPPPPIPHVQWSIDVQRVTQGLQHDFSANVDYDKIANKDVLVRVQPYVDNPFYIADLVPTSQSCSVQQVSRLIGGIELPFAGGVHNVAADEVPSQGAPMRASRELVEDPSTAHFDCWVPGSVVAGPGRYDFMLTVHTQGVTKAVTHDVGTALFTPGAPLNILLTPWFRHPTDPNYLPPSAALYAHDYRVEQQIDRTLPLATGVSGLNDDGLHPSSAGLHAVLQTPYPCPTDIPILSSDHSPSASCDAGARAQGSDGVDYWNATAASLDQQDGRHRDRYATGTTMGAISSLAGGQSCWGGESVAGSDIGPGFDDNSAFILVQEMLHCLGLVDPASPNSNPMNTAHSKNFTIGLNLFGNLGSMIDFLDHTDHNPAYSLMYPTLDGGGNANNNFLEGYEWNELHSKLLALNPQNLFTTDLFDLDLLADRSGTGAALLYAGRSTSNGILPTVPPASSDYSLEFLDAPGSVIASQPVDVSFDNSTHDNPDAPEVDTRDVNLHVPIPDGAVSWQLVHDGTPQLSGALSPRAPQISELAGIVDGTNHAIHLRWAASGAEFYRLFYQATPKTPQILVANGLTGSSFDALTDFLPPAPHGIFTLVASNGNLTTERTIKEPVTSQVSLSIIGPPAGTPVIAGAPTTFQAFGTLGSEPLDNEKCKWEVDGVVVGKGCTLTMPLTEGDHTIMLTVTSSHPHTKTSTTLPVSVGPPAG